MIAKDSPSADPVRESAPCAGPLNRADLKALVIVLYLALIPLAALPLQIDWSSHERHAYGARLAALVLAKEQGQFLGRWCPALDWGYGYPLFTFYGPGFYLLGAAFYKVGLGLTASWKLSLFALQLGGVAGMYGLARLFYGRAGASASAVLWAFLPYQQCNLFVRGAMAEFAALQWLAIAACFALWGIRTRRWLPSALGCAAHACLIVTHTISAMLATPLLAVLMFWAGWRWRRRWSWRPCAFLAAAVGLSAFYWLPAFAERSLVNLEAMAQGFYSYSAHFLRWRNWLDFLHWGFGPSGENEAASMPKDLGLAPSLAFAAAWGMAVFRRRRGESVPWPLKAATPLIAIWLFFTLRVSSILWAHLPMIRFVQFPWRLLGEVGFLMCWAGGAAVDMAVARVAAPGVRTGILVSSLLFIVLSPPWHLGGERTEAPQTPERVNEIEFRNRTWTVAAADEFAPRAVKEKKPEIFLPQRAVLSGESGTADVVNGGPGHWTIDVQQDLAGPVTAGFYWYPCWRLERQGAAVSTSPTDRYGLIQFDAPAGQSRFELRLVRTPAQRVGDAISAAFLVLLALSGLVPRVFRMFRGRAAASQ